MASVEDCSIPFLFSAPWRESYLLMLLTPCYVPVVPCLCPLRFYCAFIYNALCFNGLLRLLTIKLSSLLFLSVPRSGWSFAIRPVATATNNTGFLGSFPCLAAPFFHISGSNVGTFCLPLFWCACNILHCRIYICCMIPVPVAALFIHQPDLLHLLQWIPPPRMQHHVTLMLVHASSHVQSATCRMQRMVGNRNCPQGHALLC